MKWSKSLKLMAISGLALIVLASILLAGCPAPATTTPTGPTTTTTAPATPTGQAIKWKWVSITNPYVIQSKSNWIRIDYLNEKLKGRLFIDWIGGEEVIPVFEQATGVRSGVVQGCFSSQTYWATYVPSIRAAPLIYQPYAQRMTSGLYDFYDKRLREGGLQIFWFGGGKSRLGYAIAVGGKAKQPTKIADLAGLRIRSMELYTPFLLKLGCIPVTMPYGDVYEALNKRMIDGYAASLTSAVSWGFYECGGCFIDSMFYNGCSSTDLCNPAAFDALGTDLQKDLFAALAEIQPEARKFTYDLSLQDYQKFIDAGVKPLRFSEDEMKLYMQTANDAQWAEVAKFISAEDLAQLKAFAAQGKTDWDLTDF